MQIACLEQAEVRPRGTAGLAWRCFLGGLLPESQVDYRSKPISWFSAAGRTPGAGGGAAARRGRTGGPLLPGWPAAGVAAVRAADGRARGVCRRAGGRRRHPGAHLDAPHARPAPRAAGMCCIYTVLTAETKVWKPSGALRRQCHKRQIVVEILHIEGGTGFRHWSGRALPAIRW